MQTYRFISLAVIGLVLGSCSSTLVVLVPDPDGKVGEVTVSAQGGQTILRKAGESTEVLSAGSAPTDGQILDPLEIDELFGEVLKNEPRPPKRYIAYFDFDSAAISAEVKNRIPEITRDLKSRTICEMSVIGHSDRTGKAEYNEALSLDRAAAISALLVDAGVPKNCLDIRYYGESDPLIPTADGVQEPRNRRVEIEVR